MSSEPGDTYLVSFSDDDYYQRNRSLELLVSISGNRTCDLCKRRIKKGIEFLKIGSQWTSYSRRKDLYLHWNCFLSDALRTFKKIRTRLIKEERLPIAFALEEFEVEEETQDEETVSTGQLTLDMDWRTPEERFEEELRTVGYVSIPDPLPDRFPRERRVPERFRWTVSTSDIQDGEDDEIVSQRILEQEGL